MNKPVEGRHRIKFPVGRQGIQKFFFVASLFAHGIILLSAIVILLIKPSAQLSAFVKTQYWFIDTSAGADFPLSEVLISPHSPILKAKCPSEEIEGRDTSLTFFENTKNIFRIEFWADQGVNNTNGVTLKIIPAPTNQGPYGQLMCGNRTHLIDHFLTLKLNSNIVLQEEDQPFGLANIAYSNLQSSSQFKLVTKGYATLGSSPKIGGKYNPILIEGFVLASSSSFPSNTGRVTEENSLMRGDTLTFHVGDKDSDQSETFLVAHFDKESALFEIVAHTKAKSARVKQIGRDDGYQIGQAPTLWKRLEAQGEWALILGIFAIILSLLNTVLSYQAGGSRAES